tara:strand:- start:11 stop:523 length:513 start_codon:yes stop_codon:yes gene_type:complete
MIILSLGSNLSSKFGDRFDNLNLAVSFLESYGILIDKKSSFYESISYPDKTNPKFINIIVSVKTNLPPIDLLSVLIHIEEKLERKRNKKNEPRTCDIDIIDYNSELINLSYRELKLEIPHKDLSSRNFVLFPLFEIAPNWEHPKTGHIVSSLIDKLSKNDRNSILKVKKN